MSAEKNLHNICGPAQKLVPLLILEKCYYVIGCVEGRENSYM